MDHGPAPSTATGHYWNTLQSDAEIRMHLPIIELQSILWSSNIIYRNIPFSKKKDTQFRVFKINEQKVLFIQRKVLSLFS